MVDPVNNRGYMEYRRVNKKAGTGMENGEKFSLEQGLREKDSKKDKDGKTKVEADGVIAEFSGQPKGQQGGIGSGRKTEGAKGESIDFDQAAESVRGFLGELVKAVAGFFSGIKNTLLDFWNSDSGEASGSGETAESGEAQKIAQDGETAGNGEAGERIDGEEAGAQSQEMVQEGDAHGYGSELPIDVTERSRALEGAAWLDTIEAEGVRERAAGAKLTGMAAKRAEAERYLENGEEMGRYVKNSDLLTYYDKSGRIVQMSGSDKSRILHGDTRTSRGV